MTGVMKLVGIVTSSFIRVAVMTFACLPHPTSAQVQFVPIHSCEVKICAVDTPSRVIQTSKLADCTLKCFADLPHCLQFNYVLPSNCALYDFRPVNYIISADCQHYVEQSAPLPRNCHYHLSNGHNDNGIYTVVTDSPLALRNIYCFMSAAPWTVARDCADILASGSLDSGIYTVHVNGIDIDVYCDMTTEGGGWLVFQRRMDGSVDFEREWNAYADGFGDLHTEFWLGNENLHLLTSGSPDRSYILRIDLGDYDGETRFAEYSNVVIASAAEYYQLQYDSYIAGDDGDSMTERHKGSEFSTSDRDRDTASVNCAEKYKGGWWYGACHHANLNGKYQTDSTEGVVWEAWRGHYHSLKFTEMKIRPVA